MNTAALIQHVGRFVNYCAERVEGESSPSEIRDSVLVAHLEPVVEIARRLRPDLVQDLTPQSGLQYRWKPPLTAAIRLREWLNHNQDLQEALGPSGPSLATAAMHPRVWMVAAPHWDDHPHVAVREAARAIAIFVRERVGRTDGDSDLAIVSDAFQPDPPIPGQPRLRVPLPPSATTNTETSLQKGVQAFARGCMQAIRNVHIHDDVEIARDEALEMLAALSLLARWTERSELEHVGDGPN